MDIFKSNAYIMGTKALDYRATRQDLISSNIANVDTPYYKPRDISFEDVLYSQRSKTSNNLELATTSSTHLQPMEFDSVGRAKLFFRDGHLARNDANSVDIDVETTEMSKNFTMYNALVNAIKKDISIYRSVIDASAKVG